MRAVRRPMDTVNPYTIMSPAWIIGCRVPALRPNVPPPPHYYADNIVRLLTSVDRQYSDILMASERDYIRRVLNLGIDAQRLYARMLSRKRGLLRNDSLHYREVHDVAAARAALVTAALLADNPADPADQYLALLTRGELRLLFPRMRAPRKSQLIDRIAAQYPDAVIRSRVSRCHPQCRPLDLDRLALMQLLFFGDAHTDPTTLILEDLGMLRFETYPLDPARRQFRSRAELDDYLDLLLRREQLRALQSVWLPGSVSELFEALRSPRATRFLERARSGLLNQFGHVAERAGERDLAIAIYACSSRPPARERRIRLLSRAGDTGAADQLLADIDREPHNAGERYFAAQFRSPRRRRPPKPVELVLRLPGPPPASVEAAALAVLTRDGGAGAHLENALPRGMLGIALWDVLFTPVESAFVNPYQAAPLDLYWGDFRRSRTDLIERRLMQLRCPGALVAAIERTALTKRGISNALVVWGALGDELLAAATASVGAAAWVKIFDYMLDDLEQSRTGFPDLAIFYGPGAYAFTEVKGPGDQLRREQLLWFEFFARAGISASVLRVVW